MKILPNKIWFKIGTKFTLGNIYYKIIDDLGDKWMLKDYGKWGYISSVFTEFDVDKELIQRLFEQNRLENILNKNKL